MVVVGASNAVAHICDGAGYHPINWDARPLQQTLVFILSFSGLCAISHSVMDTIFIIFLIL